MSKRKDIDLLHQTGITTDNKKVIAGIFAMYQINGVPFESVFSFLQENNSVPDWIDLYIAAKKHGMAHARILAMLTDAIQDSYNIDWVNVVISRLDEIFG
jgi:hypothetical protein